MYYVIGKSRVIESSGNENDQKSLQTHARLNGYEFFEVKDAPEADAKLSRIEMLNILFKQSMDALKVDVPDPLIQYTDQEITTWPQQVEEAKAWNADNNASTPMLSAMAAKRQIPMSEMVSRVLTAADLYAGQAGILLGKRQAIMKQILDSVDPASINVEQLWNG